MRAVLAVVLLALSVPSAQAQRRSALDDIKRAQEHVDLGDRLFDEKRYDEAIAEYTAALVLAPHADLVWNIARAHEEKDRLSQAIALFERYRSMQVSDGDRAEADLKITELRRRVKAKRTGTLVVTTPSPLARVHVGGTLMGQGERVIVDLKPGRYRVRVELADHDPFEGVVTVGPAGEAALDARPQAIRKTAVLIVRVDVPGARVSVDGGAPVEAGTAVQVREGPHTVRVLAEDRAAVETVVPVAADERKEVRIALGPIRHPEHYESWAGRYVVLTPEGSEHERYRGAQLTLGEGDEPTGVLLVDETRTLETWRRDACGGARTVSWTTRYRASLSARGTLSLAGGEHTACTCETWCELRRTDGIDLTPLPGREGLVGPMVVLRTELAGEHTRPWVDSPHQTALRDTWEVVLWRGEARTDDRIALSDEGGALVRSLSGALPSWKRSRCGGAETFRQVARFGVDLAVEADRVELDLGAPRELACSCEGACGAPALLADETLRLLVFSRYLVGDGTLLRRAQESEPSATPAAPNGAPPPAGLR